MQLERQISAGCRFYSSRHSDHSVYNNRNLGIKELGLPGDAPFVVQIYYPSETRTQEVRVIVMPPAPREKKIRKPAIDRAYFRSEEFKKQFAESIDTVMEDPEYLENIKLWDVTVGDGVTGRGISKA